MIIREVKSLLLYVIIIGLMLFIGGCPYDDDVDEDNDEDVVCDGQPSECFEPLYGWRFEGKVIDEPDFMDVSVVRLDDGRYRLYGNASSNPNPGQRGFDSFISDDGVSFQKEDGYRLAGPGIFMPFVITLPDGNFRLYFTDQEVVIGEEGGRAIMSAISDDGIDFTVEEGDRLTYSGNDYESSGIRGAKILELDDESYRMYYHGIDNGNCWRVLSAVSQDGLEWTRENGARIDPSDLCPPATRIGNAAPFITSDGVYHLYIATGTCKENYANGKFGIFDFTSMDGLTFTPCEEPIIENYFKANSYTGDPSDPAVMPQDPAVIMTGSGLRMYLGVYDGPHVIEESAIYSLIHESIV